jgi:beta-glucosidase
MFLLFPTGVMTAMESYNDVGGVPMISSSEYLRDMLRQDMGFEGLLVTDWAEIENLHNWHKVAATQKDAVEIALMNTSIDMSMVPSDTTFYEYTLDLVQSGVISSDRLDESVLRILKVKDALGLFDAPVPPRSDPLVATVGQDEDWAAALNTARESITLLKNNGSACLPLPSSAVGTGKTIFVTGPTSNSLVAQTGGWTFHWQGAVDDSNFTRGVTVKQGIEQVFSDATVRDHAMRSS